MGKRSSKASGSEKRVVAMPNAPVASRLYAYVIDWALGGIVSGFPAVVAYALLTRRTDMFSDLYTFEALGFPWAVGIGVGCLCVVAAWFYFIFIPWKIWPGQTPGKRISRLRVACDDIAASPVSLPRLIVRQAIVGFLLEGSGFVVARYIREMAVLITRVDVNYYWEIAGIVITLVSAVMALALPARRALHDYLSGTRVVPAEGHPLYEEAVR